MQTRTTTSPTCSSSPSTRCPTASRSIDQRRRVTYRELDERANRLAHALREPGVKPGDHVGIYATNCIEWVEAMFGDLQDPRAASVNVNFRYVEDELRYLFDNSDLVALVYQREYGPLVAAARDAQPQLQHFVAHRGTAPTPTTRALDPIEFEAAIASGSPERDFGRALRRRHLPPLHRRHHRHAQGRDVAPGGRVLRARRRHRRVHEREGHDARRGERQDRSPRSRRASSSMHDPAAHARRRPVRRSFRVAVRGQHRR